MKALLRSLPWLLVFAWQPSDAHRASDAHLRLALDEAPYSGRLDIAVRDLDVALGVDLDGNGAVTWGELRERHPAIEGYALSRLELSSAGDACRLSPGRQQLADRADGIYAVLPFAIECPHGRRPDALRYALLFDVDSDHRGLLQVDTAGHTGTVVLSPQSSQVALAGDGPGRWTTLASYWREGVIHILVGFDHLLFLMTLLLPAVLVRQDRRWRPARSPGQAALDIAGVVTAFTVAHSVTLGSAVLGWIDPPSTIVEPLIAGTVLLAALNNLFPVWNERRWVLAFALGLVHGFGFAGVLGEMRLPADALLPALAGFNIGVECGQLAVVAAVAPLLWHARGLTAYRRLVLGGGSLAVAITSLVWLVERAVVPLAAAAPG